jgi:hypothetical protein
VFTVIILIDVCQLGALLPVARQLCGLHAQVLSSAALTVWARVDGIERGAVQHALGEHRTLVKTWDMRGTLHLLPADDLSLWHAALSTTRRYRTPAFWRRFGLTLKELDRLTEAIGSALDGCVMTREGLAQKVGNIPGDRAPEVTSQALQELLWRVCLDPLVGGRGRLADVVLISSS